VGCRNLAGRHLESGKERRGPIALVIMALPGRWAASDSLGRVPALESMAFHQHK
jgi:hypothetical protein